MEMNEVILFIGAAGVVLGILAKIGDRLLDKGIAAFEKVRELEKQIVDDKLEAMEKSYNLMRQSIDNNTKGLHTQTIMMDGLTKAMDQLRSELKSVQNHYSVSLDKLGAVLHSFNYQIKQSRDEIDKLSIEVGKVIRKEK